MEGIILPLHQLHIPGEESDSIACSNSDKLTTQTDVQYDVCELEGAQFCRSVQQSTRDLLRKEERYLSRSAHAEKKRRRCLEGTELKEANLFSKVVGKHALKGGRGVHVHLLRLPAERNQRRILRVTRERQDAPH